MVRLAKNDDIREFALRALAENRAEAATIAASPFISALNDANARVRLQAATALGRLDKKEAAAALLPLVADKDPIVSHAAIHALVSVRAADVCLKALDSPGTTALVPGAVRVLQSLHEAAAVDGLITRLGTISDPATHQAILRGLARLYNREADWDGKWWGTRPDTTGPYYKPVTWELSDKIGGALRGELSRANTETLRFLATELQRNRVDLPELTPLVLKLANEDAAFKPIAVEMFSARSVIPDGAIPLFTAVASSTDQTPVLRAKAMRALLKAGRNPAAADGALAGAVAITEGKSQGDLNTAWEDFVRDPRQAQSATRFEKLAASGSPAERTVAYGVLVTLSSGKLASKEAKASATAAIDQSWNKPETAVPLLRAISRLRNDSYALQVRSLVSDARPEVASAAKQASAAIGQNEKRGNNTEPLIDTLKYEQVVAAASKDKGDVKRGRELFTKQGCVACHTTSAEETPKGPFLGGIATRYSRAELCESILKPSLKIAQGFETQWFKTKDDEEVEGFVSREGGDDLDVRNIAGITTTLAKKNIAERGKRETSMMPPGLADKMTPGELASMLAFLESLKSK